MSDPVHLEGIGKQFGSHWAVRHLSLRIPDGAMYGIIGPNGSGKTTTLRMILGIISPDEGTLNVFGRKSHPSANTDVAYLPEERGLYRKLTVMRQLVYFARLKGMSRRDAYAAARYWLERLGLEDWGRQKLEALSKGMSQKVQFIATVISRPRLLVLDEPFSGLDPVNMESIRAVIQELRGEGTTVLFSTHNMQTAEAMCDRICMVYRGEKVLDDHIGDIKRRYASHALRLRLGPENRFEPASVAGVKVLMRQGCEWELDVDGDPRQLLREAIDCGAVELFASVEPSLHDIFVRIASPKPEEMEDTFTGGTP